jgi:hypothetical protein
MPERFDVAESPTAVTDPASTSHANAIEESFMKRMLCAAALIVTLTLRVLIMAT